MLIFIYYFKNIMSITDIQHLLEPLTQNFFSSDSDFNLERLYTEVFSLEKGQIETLKQDIVNKYNLALTTYEDADAKDQEFLKKFSFICLLSFDIYLKKQIVENLIDDMDKEKTLSKK